MKTYHMTNPYMKGDPPGDLKDLQAALYRAKLYHGTIDDVFGPGTGDACRNAKYRLGYPMSAVVRSGGQDLLNLLRGTTKLPPLYVVRRHARGFGLTIGQRQRARIVAICKWAVEHEPQIHYFQLRPMDALNKPMILPGYTDCSEFVTTVYKWAGCPDPNGFGYNGYGNTDSLFNHGQFIPVYQSDPGDVVNWGRYPTHHTAMVVDVSNRNDPIVCSHGSERGPLNVSLSQETRAQHGRPYYVKRYLGT
jgi:hypothetical protein